MSDKILNIINPQKGVIFSEKQLAKDKSKVISELDKRITDILHKIEFSNFTQKESYRLMMKLQMFLKKKRALKKIGKVYIPRTESGNFIVKGKVLNKK